MFKTQKEKIKEGILDLILNLAVILLLVFLIRSYIIAPFNVSGPSMCDTLNNIDGKCVPDGRSVGEFMLIDKLSYIFGSPRRGDIVVFKPPGNPLHFIKRVIATGGETLEINKDGFVYLTDARGERRKLDELYLNEENYGNTKPMNDGFRKFTVPEGKYFVMGDNRAHSSDSRHCFSGCESLVSPNAFISKKDIKGRALITLWPIGNMKFISHFDYSF